MQKILTFLQIVAIVLYPAAISGGFGVSSAAASPLVPVRVANEVGQSHHAAGAVVHSHKLGGDFSSAPSRAGVVLSPQAGEEKTLPCCCAGAAGLCAIFVSNDAVFGTYGHEPIKPDFTTSVVKARLSPVFHPPKSAA